MELTLGSAALLGDPAEGGLGGGIRLFFWRSALSAALQGNP
ncbi:MAG: hypothetical protein RSA12_07005 [Clostridia bacterium]